MIFIESILHDFLDQKIADIKSNPAILDQIFEGMPTETIDSIKQYFANTHIKTVYHHPRDESETPCYAIILQSSNEATENEAIGLSGDSYDEVPLSDMDDGWIGSDSEIRTTTPDAPVTVSQLYDRAVVKDGRVSCHIIGDRNASEGKGIYIDFENSVIKGGYVSLTQKNKVVFWVKSNRIGTFLRFGFGELAHEEHTYQFPVTVMNLWERITIDLAGLSDSAKDRIRYMNFVLINDDADTDVYISGLKGQTTYGSIMDEYILNNAHRIESWSNNAELTLWLYQIALWNLFKYRTYLEESWGLYLQRIEGGDIMPQPEYYPEFVFVRGLTFNCFSTELVPRESGLTAVDVRVDKIDFSTKASSMVR